jgi:hypothetical protein
MCISRSAQKVKLRSRVFRSLSKKYSELNLALLVLSLRSIADHFPTFGALSIKFHSESLLLKPFFYFKRWHHDGAPGITTAPCCHEDAPAVTMAPPASRRRPWHHNSAPGITTAPLASRWRPWHHNGAPGITMAPLAS